MSPHVFLYADPHFSHQGVCEFLRDDGTKLRPWDSALEMNRVLVENWNATVSPKDKTYILGDVAFNKKALQIVAALNGTKVLIKGNHDTEKLSVYAALFEDVRACHILGRCLLTHIPVHPASVTRWAGNIHGHTHQNRVMLDGAPDPRYLCVSVEQINYRPAPLEWALEKLTKVRASHAEDEVTARIEVGE